MLAIKSSADSRYAAVTKRLGPGRIVKCPNCMEPFTVYSKTPGMMNRAVHRVTEHLARTCLHHVEFFSANEAA